MYLRSVTSFIHMDFSMNQYSDDLMLYTALPHPCMTTSLTYGEVCWRGFLMRFAWHRLLSNPNKIEAVILELEQQLAVGASDLPVIMALCQIVFFRF